MSKTNIDGEVKQKFTEIIFAPFITLWNMAKSTDEVEDDIELDNKSSDKVISDLAKSQDEIENEVNKKYGKSMKKDRQDLLNQTKVFKEQLEANSKNYQREKASNRSEQAEMTEKDSNVSRNSRGNDRERN